MEPRFICWSHSQCRIPPVIHPAFALVYTHDGRYSHPVCQETLNNWLDNADDDDDLEPAAIVWLTSRPVTG